MWSAASLGWCGACMMTGRIYRVDFGPDVLGVDLAYDQQVGAVSRRRYHADKHMWLLLRSWGDRGPWEGSDAACKRKTLAQACFFCPQVVVRYLKPGGQADRLGVMRVDDHVLHINGHKIK